MKIEKGDMVTLSDDVEYMVISKIDYQGNTYVYLTTMDEPPKLRFCREEKINESLELNDVTDPELLKTLIQLFNDEFKTNF